MIPAPEKLTKDSGFAELLVQALRDAGVERRVVVTIAGNVHSGTVFATSADARRGGYVTLATNGGNGKTRYVTVRLECVEAFEVIE